MNISRYKPSGGSIPAIGKTIGPPTGTTGAVSSLIGDALGATGSRVPNQETIAASRQTPKRSSRRSEIARFEQAKTLKYSRLSYI